MTTKKSKNTKISAPNNHTNTGTGATAHSSEVDREVEVLYQKMGGRWYAFSVIDDQVFFSSIDPSQINPEQLENQQFEAPKKAA